MISSADTIFNLYAKNSSTGLAYQLGTVIKMLPPGLKTLAHSLKISVGWSKCSKTANSVIKSKVLFLNGSFFTYN